MHSVRLAQANNIVKSIIYLTFSFYGAKCTRANAVDWALTPPANEGKKNICKQSNYITYWCQELVMNLTWIKKAIHFGFRKTKSTKHTLAKITHHAPHEGKPTLLKHTSDDTQTTNSDKG